MGDRLKELVAENARLENELEVEVDAHARLVSTNARLREALEKVASWKGVRWEDWKPTTIARKELEKEIAGQTEMGEWVANTPGPWWPMPCKAWTRDPGHDCQAWAVRGASQQVAACLNPADSRLIAAAPDLLASLEDLMTYDETAAKSPEARAAIAKATGTETTDQA